MRLSLLTLFIFILQIPLAYAAAKFQVLGLNVDYKDEVGFVNASKVAVDTEDFAVNLENYDFNLEKNEDDLEIKDHRSTLKVKKFEEKVQLLKDLEALKISNAGITYRDSLFLTVDDIFTSFDRNSFQLNNLVLDCKTAEEDPIKDCLKHGDAEINRINIPNKMSQDLYEEIKTIEPEEEIKQLGINYTPDIKWVKLKVRENDFSGSVVIKLLFNIKFKLWGKILVDEEKKEIAIKNFTVKKGIIPVTKLVLRALKKMKIESIKIIGNNIYISI